MNRFLSIFSFFALASLGHAALSVNFVPADFVSPEAEVVVTTDVITPPGLTVTNYNFTLDPLSSYSAGFSDTYFFRSTDAPAVGTEINATTFTFYQTQSPGSNSYFRGAQVGDDNWIYITNASNQVAWAQVTINEGVVTPIKYIFDASNRTADIALADAVTAVPEAASFGLLTAIAVLFTAARRRVRR